ncbi:MAG: hydrogenase maturation nickel metallochaperone HypA [Lachnospiraceae bacterium]|nr:hydrogenase maturation nickel metallochaperone HypA [Lachnospiraceae bacterium]
MMICTCEECRYTFPKLNSSKYCPDCGSEAVRPATDKEIDEYKAYQQEFHPESQIA